MAYAEIHVSGFTYMNFNLWAAPRSGQWRGVAWQVELVVFRPSVALALTFGVARSNGAEVDPGDPTARERAGPHEKRIGSRFF
jgi:hypothetical protein